MNQINETELLCINLNKKLKFNTNTKNSKNSKNLKKKKETKDLIFMNIDVKDGMCQGVKIINNKSYSCMNKSCYLIKNKFNLCREHKFQKISY